MAKKTNWYLLPSRGLLPVQESKKVKGVCGTSWERAQTLIVPDVEKFPGHIACSSLSRSEIVVPLIHNNEVVGVLDVDSDQLNHFNETDQFYLEQIVKLISF